MSAHIAMYLLNDADERTAMLIGVLFLTFGAAVVILGGYAWWQEWKENKNKKPE